MSECDDVVEKIPVNMDSVRDDIKPLLDQINPLLKQVLDILLEYPDESADVDPDQAAGFSKVLYSRVKTS